MVANTRAWFLQQWNFQTQAMMGCVNMVRDFAEKL
jgi:hypothetical protein